METTSADPWASMELSFKAATFPSTTMSTITEWGLLKDRLDADALSFQVPVKEFCGIGHVASLVGERQTRSDQSAWISTASFRINELAAYPEMDVDIYVQRRCTQICCLVATFCHVNFSGQILDWEYNCSARKNFWGIALPPSFAGIEITQW